MATASYKVASFKAILEMINLYLFHPVHLSLDLEWYLQNPVPLRLVANNNYNNNNNNNNNNNKLFNNNTFYEGFLKNILV